MFDKFYNYLSELQRSYATLAAMLTEKLGAIDRFDIVRLDEIMKDEQVFVLTSRSFDKTIAAHREQLGLSGETLREIITELPLEERARFQELFIRLQATVEQTKNLNDRCQALIEERLYAIDKQLRQLDQSAMPHYGKATAANRQSHLLTRSV